MSSAARAGQPLEAGVLGTDYRLPEVLVAMFIALSVPVWSMVLLRLTNLALEANAPAIDAGDEISMRVKPVIDMDSPLLKLGGGKKVRAKLPDMWKKPDPPPQTIKKQKAQVSTNAKDDVSDIPDEDLELSDAGEAIDPDAEVVKEAEVELEADGGELPEGEGSPMGSPEGTETDPLKARAANQYKARIYAFLKRGFSCPANLTDEDKKCRATGSVVISGGSVASFTFSPCGNAKIDGPAQSTISSKVGQSLPPPPANYPDLLPSNFTVAYSCQ